MPASRSGLAKTDGPAWPDAAWIPGLALHFETIPARQSVARRSSLRTYRQNCGTSTVSGGSAGGNRARRMHTVEPQLRFETLISADRVVGGSKIP